MVGKKGPFGGFCNYGIFGIWGKDPETGKKSTKRWTLFQKWQQWRRRQLLAAWIRRASR